MTILREAFIRYFLLSAILLFYGMKLVATSQQIHSVQQKEQRRLRGNEELVFQSHAGIDIRGSFVESGVPKKNQKFLIFLLRGDSLFADVEFWSKVQANFPVSSGLRLVGFCDGTSCADRVRQFNIDSKFPVIQYAEAISSQALLSADAEGNALLQEYLQTVPKPLIWRNHIKPEEFVAEVHSASK